MRSIIRNILIQRARKRISETINTYTKSYYPDFDFSKPVEGEQEYLKKWEGFLPNLDPLYYRLYSSISGVKSVNYLPDDIYVIFILNLLNDREKDHLFKDKNFYDLIFREGIFPDTYLRNIKGVFLDANYQNIENVDDFISGMSKLHDEVIVKPSTDTSSGKNVMLFKKNKEQFVDKIGNILSKNFLLNNFKSNFLVQKRLKQSDFFNNLNPSSINTIRIYTYRSVKDNQIFTLTNSIRVGGNKSITDNLNSGGYGIGVDMNGKLFNVAIDKYAKKITEVGEFDLNQTNIVPDFEEFLNISKKVAEKFIYDRFLGLDVFRDNNGKMRLMEVNLGHIGTDLPHLIGTSMFGEFTDEIIHYCHENKDKLDQHYNMKI